MNNLKMYYNEDAHLIFEDSDKNILNVTVEHLKIKNAKKKLPILYGGANMQKYNMIIEPKLLKFLKYQKEYLKNVENQAKIILDKQGEKEEKEKEDEEKFPKQIEIIMDYISEFNNLNIYLKKKDYDIDTLFIVYGKLRRDSNKISEKILKEEYDKYIKALKYKESFSKYNILKSSFNNYIGFS